MIFFLLFLGFLAFAPTADGHLYAMKDGPQLVRYDLKTGAAHKIGGVVRNVAPQAARGVADSARSLFFFVTQNATTNEVQLMGLDLNKGHTRVLVKIPEFQWLYMPDFGLQIELDGSDVLIFSALAHTKNGFVLLRVKPFAKDHRVHTIAKIPNDQDLLFAGPSCFFAPQRIWYVFISLDGWYGFNVDNGNIVYNGIPGVGRGFTVISMKYVPSLNASYGTGLPVGGGIGFYKFALPTQPHNEPQITRLGTIGNYFGTYAQTLASDSASKTMFTMLQDPGQKPFADPFRLVHFKIETQEVISQPLFCARPNNTCPLESSMAWAN